MNTMIKGALIGAGVIVLVFCLFFGGMWTGKACLKKNIEKQLIIDDQVEICSKGRILLFKFVKVYEGSRIEKELMQGTSINESEYTEQKLL